MSDPGAVERNETAGVDSAGEDILRDEDAFVPEEDLVATCELVSGVLALADALEPVVIGVGAVGALEPFVDEHVRSVVVELLAFELAHREARRDELGVVEAGHRAARAGRRARRTQCGGGASEDERRV